MVAVSFLTEQSRCAVYVHPQIVENGTERVGIIANDTIDGLWWMMNDDWTYIKIRWSSNDPMFKESWRNEDIFVISGFISVETEPSTVSPHCFSQTVSISDTRISKAGSTPSEKSIDAEL